MDTIQPNARVVLDYVLTDDTGRELDSSTGEGCEPITYVHGYGMMVGGLEAALVGLRQGDTKEVVVAAEDAFGPRDEELVFEVDRSEMPRPKDVAPGDELVAESPDGDEVTLRVVEVHDESVVVDANHPLAGLTLHYKVSVRDVRAATDAEIAEAAAKLDRAMEEEGLEPAPEGDPSLVQLGRRPKK
jgi:FKBP-type peptidyl-prolyl cis-trans isomerase SlyD